MKALRRLTGLVVFVAALVCAVALSRYFSGPRATAGQEAAAQVVVPETASAPASDAASPEGVRFKPRLVVLDLPGRKSFVTLELEHDAGRAAPERLWARAHFFSPGSRCAGEAVEVRQPFLRGRRATVVVEAPTRGCVAPGGAAATFYARVQVSAESAEAAGRLADSGDEDITKATPVVLQGAGR